MSDSSIIIIKCSHCFRLLVAFENSLYKTPPFVFRSWKVAEKLRSDVTEILKQGRRCVLKCLLQTREIFRATDTAPCYLLNDLYLDDYCVWIQNELRCDATLASLAHVIESVKILKSDVGFELVLVEKAAALVLEEQDSDLNSGSLVNDLNSLTI